MVFRPVDSPGLKPRNPVVKMTIRGDGSVSKVELLRSSRVKPWDEEVLNKMKTARYSEAHGCGERTSEMQIRIDYSH
jgi:TonB family protein